MGPEGTWRCSECPATQPMNGSMCSEMTNNVDCPYTTTDGTTTCQCNGGDGWQCMTCPAMEPMDGSPCDDTVNDQCDYGQTTCECGGNGMWNCGG